MFFFGCEFSGVGAGGAALLFHYLVDGLLHGRLVFGLGPRGTGRRPGSFPVKVHCHTKRFAIRDCKCKSVWCKERLMWKAVFPTRRSFRLDRDGWRKRCL